MWIVDLALRRPLTFIVLAIFILISGVLCIITTPKDIFPNIDIPVVSVIFNFAGMSPDQVEAHITSPYERVLTTTVDDIQHIESQSLYGIVVIKVFLQPTASLAERRRANHGDFSNDSQAAAHGNDASVDYQLHGVERARDTRVGLGGRAYLSNS